MVVRKAGKKRFYNLAGDDVVDLISSLRKTAEAHSAEVERLTQHHFTRNDALEPIGAPTLLRRLQHNEVTLIDTRPTEEFSNSHLPNAINIPTEEMHKHIHHLTNDKDIVAYCRGPYCLFAYDAVNILRNNGFNAMRLNMGFPQWKAAGYPVQSH